MRLAIFLASVLVLSGCASAEPREETPVASQVTEQEASDTETQDDAEVAEMESAEPEPSETTEEESEEGEEETGESAETRETEVSEPEESEQEASDESEQEESVEQENESADDDSAQEPEATEEPSPSPTPEETTLGYTLAQVSQRDSAAECWVAIDGGVYDLTSWIRSHPGGSGAILNLCGKDGTSSFTSQHGGQARPTSTLDGYYIAPLVG